MFTQSAYIKKNTQELREKLRVLGYRILPDLFHFPCLSINNGLAVPADTLNRNGGINCEENEDLFLAIAALRDNSDFMQWFIHDDSDWNEEPNIFWYQCKSEKIEIDLAYNIMHCDCHKASVKELIEHFNIKPE